MRLSEENKKKILKTVVFIEIMAVILIVGEFIYDKKVNITQIDRPSKSDTTEEFDVSLGDYREDISLDISKQGLSKKEESAYIDQAKGEIEDTFPGDNKSCESICTDVVMKEEYAGCVEAEWYLDSYSVVDATGHILQDKVDKKQVINASVTLTCEDTSEVYEFSFVVVPLSKNSKAGISYYLNKAFLDAESEGRDSDVVKLPKKLFGDTITVRRKYTFLGVKIGLLGLMIAVGIKLGEKIEEKQREKNFYRDLQMDYPAIVESLSLYVGAGLSFKNAFFRIAKEYSQSSRSRPGFDGVVYLCNNIADGMSEAEAYRLWPSYCPTKEYRKLSSIIISGMKKGTKGMREILEKEEEEAFEKQKAMIKVMGDEASTKLLIPMVGLLAIVLLIVIAPAMINMQF